MPHKYIYMAHEKNAEHDGHPGKEGWGRRPVRNYPISHNSRINKFFKRLAHKIERRFGKKEIEKELMEKQNVKN